MASCRILIGSCHLRNSFRSSHYHDLQKSQEPTRARATPRSLPTSFHHRSSSQQTINCRWDECRLRLPNPGPSYRNTWFNPILIIFSIDFFPFIFTLFFFLHIG
ncbi:hypothetical protein L3Y34_004260 [Caenorhabditis briggsae]|uniref:Uncharacterized protein n=1 Tax=Caenorhabditis briggsae TaxID=6238 RepID=A0AAE9D6V5_CAEBR|nr:hypothetical protein L3Y34_004260 [Caenorhabditis briggsae]